MLCQPPVIDLNRSILTINMMIRPKSGGMQSIAAQVFLNLEFKYMT